MSKIEVFQITQLLALAIFVSVSVRENLREFRKKLKHKIRTIEKLMPFQMLFQRPFEPVELFLFL
jgi:hypothetical protein